MGFGEKLIATIISEFVEALLFICILLFLGAMPDYQGKESIVLGVISLWGIMGVGTPFVIWLELGDAISGALKGGLN